jgi:hypothetical protein
MYHSISMEEPKEILTVPPIDVIGRPAISFWILTPQAIPPVKEGFVRNGDHEVSFFS